MIDDNSWLLNRPIAHRGLHGDVYPENSTGAFEYAIELGFPIEMDVRLSSDGVPIVFHDKNLERMTGDSRDIADVPLKELLSMRLANTDYGIPTLAEFLLLVSGKVPILLEVKNSGKVGKLEHALVSFLQRYEGELAVHSFNPNSLAFLHAQLPQITLGLLSCSFRGESLPWYKKFVLRHMFLVKKSGAEFLNYDIRELPNKRAEKCKLPLLCWTVRSQDEYEKAKRLAQNIIFENFIPT